MRRSDIGETVEDTSVISCRLAERLLQSGGLHVAKRCSSDAYDL